MKLNNREVNITSSKYRMNILEFLQRLRKYWAPMRMFYKYQPLDLVRSYMGEQVAFFFAVSGFLYPNVNSSCHCWSHRIYLWCSWCHK